MATVVSTPEPRNARPSRLPAYRSSYMGRYHPYPRSGRSSCQERLMSTFDHRYEEELVREAEEPLIVPSPRVNTCTEVPDCDTSPFEDEPLRVDGVEVGPESTDTAAIPPAPASPMLIDVIAALLAALRHRYFERLRALKQFLLLE